MAETQESDNQLAPKAHNVKGFLSAQRLGLILKLQQEGKTQADIASFLGINQAAICRAVKLLGIDTTDLARHHLKAKSFSAALKATALVKSGKPDVALKAAKLVLTGSGVISDTSTVQVGVQVMIGTSGTPALAADSVEVEVLDGTVSPTT